MMLTEAQRTIINGYESISVQEESLLQNQLEHDYTKQVQVLSIVLRAAGSTTYDAFIQDLAFNQLNAAFNNRASQSNTAVALLNTIFKIATQSSLLNADQKKQVAPMFATLSLEKALAITDPATRIAALQDFINNNPNLALTADQQTTLQAGLQALTNPLPTDATMLSNLSKVLGGLNGSNPQLASSFLPQVGTALNAATLQAALALTDPAARIAALQDFITKNPTATLNADQQAALQASLKALADNPPTDLAALNNLTKVLGSLNNNGMLSPEMKTQLSSTLMPAVTTALNAANIDAALKSALTTSDPAARVAALQQFISSNPNATLSADEQKALQAGLLSLANNPPTDTASLGTLAKVLTSLGGNSALPAEVQAQLTGKVTAAIDTANMNTALQDALALTDPIARVAALEKFMAEHPNATLSPAMQTALQTGLKALADNPPTDLATLSSLAKVLNGLGGNGNALPSATQAQLADKVNTALNTASMNDELQNALALTDPAARITALQKFMSNHSGATLSPVMQTALQNGLKDIAHNLPKSPAALESLNNMLNEISDNALLSPAFKNLLTKKILPAVKKAGKRAERTAHMLEEAQKALTVAQAAAQEALADLTEAQTVISTEASAEQIQQAIAATKKL